MATKSNGIGDRLKAVRVALGHTQEQFSKVLLGKENKATISAYENGRLDIAEKAKVILFTTYSVNKDWLEKGEGEMFTTTSEKAYNAARDTNKYDPQPTNLTEFLLMDKLNSIHRELETLKRQMNELNKKKPPEDVED